MRRYHILMEYLGYIIVERGTYTAYHLVKTTSSLPYFIMVSIGGIVTMHLQNMKPPNLISFCPKNEYHLYKTMKLYSESF